jgi:transposase
MKDWQSIKVIPELTKEQASKMIKDEPELAADLLVVLTRTVNVLSRKVDELTAKVEELEGRLSKNSSNSSKPPSSDGYTKPSPKSLRKKSGKKSGGQRGHKGTTLSQVSNPDEIITHRSGKCCCGLDLENGTVLSEERRQVFDIPTPRVEVIEHIVQTVKCSCGEIHTGTFPEGVTSPTQYGPGVRSLAVYLNQYQHLPYERTCEALRDVFGCSLSQGTLKNILAECYSKLELAEEAIKRHIRSSKVAHFDETGLRIDKKTRWVHSASTESAAHYCVHDKRGAEAPISAGILPGFKGTAVHDGWKSYMSFPCRHSLCNAHHLRELLFIEEQFKQRWPKKMADLLLEIHVSVQEAKEHGLAALKPELLERFTTRYEQLLSDAYTENPWEKPTAPPRRGRKKKTKSLNLIERLDKQRNEVLLFMNDFSVPFDNNLAERDIRMVKLRQKISGCFRDFSGAQIFCRMRSYISTARKNDIGAMDALTRVFTGNPFIIDS